MLITHNYFVAAFGPLCAKETILHSADIFFDFVTLFRLLFGYYSSLISSMRRVYRGNLIKSKSSKGTQEHSHNFFLAFSKTLNFWAKMARKGVFSPRYLLLPNQLFLVIESLKLPSGLTSISFAGPIISFFHIFAQYRPWEAAGRLSA